MQICLAYPFVINSFGLRLDDFQDLLSRDASDLFFVRRLGAGGDAGGLLQQDSGWRRLRDERE